MDIFWERARAIQATRIYIIPDEFGKAGTDSYIEFDRLKIKHDVFLGLIKSYKEINFYFDVFGDSSLERVISLNQETQGKIHGVKFHTTSSLDFNLINNATNHFKKIIISISGLSITEISYLNEYLDKNNFENEIILSYGVQNYPTKIEDIKLKKLLLFKNIFNYNICISDHLPGDNDLSKDIIYYAYLLGYDYIEKHISLDNNRGLDDDVAALNIDDFPFIIEKLNTIRQLISGHSLVLNDKELEYRNKAKNAYHSNTSIKKGHIFCRDDIYSSRLDNGENIPSMNLDEIIGKTAAIDIAENTILKAQDLEQLVYGVIIVRADSKRLNNKCYEKLLNTESIRILIKRIKKSRSISRIILATTKNKEDDLIEKISKEESVDCIRGSENVYKRINIIFKKYDQPNFFIRLTGDNIFVDPSHIDQCVDDIINFDKEYYRHEKVIDGCDFEIISYKYYRSLKYLYSNIKDQSEYLTLFLNNEFVQKLTARYYSTKIDFEKYRLTLDYPEDLENCKNLAEFFGNYMFSYEEICDALYKEKIYKGFHSDDKSLSIKPKKKYY